MNIDRSVYDIDMEFGELNCGNSFVYMNHLYIKANITYPESESTGYLAVRLCHGESKYMSELESVKLVKTKSVRDNG